MKKEIYNKLKEQVNNLEVLLNGGKGSGNFGHSGRPGQIGGSGKGAGRSNTKNIDDEIEKARKKLEKLEKANKEAIKRTQIHQKYLEQGLSNIQEKTVAEQERKIKALRKIKIEYRDAISEVGKDELDIMSRLDKQEKDALEYLEKLKKIESSKKRNK